MRSTAAKIAAPALVAAGILHATAYPMTKLGSRAPGFTLGNLVTAVKQYLWDRNAYDPDVPDKCVLSVSTFAGSDCSATVSCPGDNQLNGQVGGKDFENWSQCFLDGEQHLTDDRIGDFYIKFTEAGGVNSDQDGLHHPMFAFADFNNWEEWDVEQIIADMTPGDAQGNLCMRKNQDQSITYKCGIPLEGGPTVFGHSFIGDDDDVDGGYEAGWCTAHVAQYQRNELGTGDKYAFDVTLYDNAKNQIAHIQHQEVDDDGHISVGSPLEWTLELHSGAGDADPVSFAYGQQSWTCDGGDGGGHACTLGDGAENGFERGDREGDMGFTC